MYTFLNQKLRNSKGGAIVDQLVFLAFEIEKEGKSDFAEEFEQKSDKDICEILSWRKEKDVFESIQESREEDSVLYLMYRAGHEGFLARVLFPVCSNFRFSKENSKKPSSWASSQGRCFVDYVYSDTIAELAEKIQKKSDDYFNIELKKHIESLKCDSVS